MENRKDIGKAFREKLDGLQRAPGDHVWQAIKDDLPKKKKRRAIIFWWFISVPTALLVLGLFGYPLWENYGSGNAPKVKGNVNSEITNTSNGSSGTLTPRIGTSGIDNNEATEGTASQNNTVNTNVNDVNSNSSTRYNGNGASQGKIGTGNSSYVSDAVGNGTESSQADRNKKRRANRNSNSGIASSEKRNNIASGKKTRKYNNGVDANSASLNTDGSAKAGNANNAFANAETAADSTATEDPKAVAENKPAAKGKAAAAKAKTENAKKTADTLRRAEEETVLVEVKKKKKQEKPSDDNKRMFIYGFAGPTIYSAGDADYIDASASGKDISVKNSFGYGAYLGYNITPKWSIRAGVISSKAEVTTENLYLSGTPANYTGIKYADNISNQSVLLRLTQGLDGSNQPYANFNITHDVSFIDVPVEATYNFYGTKFRVGIIGGVTARFITKNDMYAENNMGRVLMGEATDDKVRFGAGLGAGLSYKFTPSIQANVEPMARYYFDSPKSLKPFTFALQVGLQYNFNLSKKKK